MSYIKIDRRLAYYRCKLSGKLACPVNTLKIVKWFPRIHTHNNAAAEALIKTIVREKVDKYVGMPTSVVMKNKLLKQRQTAFKLPPGLKCLKFFN